MRFNEYNNSIDLPKTTFIPQAEGFSSKFIEKLLLILIAILGVIGSLYVFTNSSNNNNTPNYHNLSLVAASVSDFDSNTLDGKVKFKDFIKIEGKKKAGVMLNFKFKKDRHVTRYVMEMGNGERVIITADEFPYKFDKSGTYTLELKTITRGLITTLATKKLKIKN